MQPLVVYLLGVYFWAIEIELIRNAVVMAAMAPGLNAYFFATIYGECRDIVATTILVSTGLTILSSSFWIYFLS
jgi:predicted permease